MFCFSHLPLKQREGTIRKKNRSLMFSVDRKIPTLGSTVAVGNLASLVSPLEWWTFESGFSCSYWTPMMDSIFLAHQIRFSVIFTSADKSHLTYPYPTRGIDKNRITTRVVNTLVCKGGHITLSLRCWSWRHCDVIFEVYFQYDGRQRYVLSIHWLYRRARNFVVKTSKSWCQCDITSHMSAFNMANVNLANGHSFVKIKSWRPKVCQKKNLSWFFGADINIRPSGSLFGITRHSLVMPNSNPRTDFSIRTSHPWKSVRIFHECEVWIEQSVPRDHCSASRGCHCLASRGYAKWCQTVIPRDGFFYSHRTTTVDSFSCIPFELQRWF